MELIYNVKDTSDWSWRNSMIITAVNIAIVMLLATAAQIYIDNRLQADEVRRANTEDPGDKGAKRNPLLWCGIDPCHTMEKHVAQQQRSSKPCHSTRQTEISTS